MSRDYRKRPGKRPKKRKKSNTTLIVVLSVCGGLALVVLVITVFLIVPAFRGANEANNRRICKNNLKMIGLALHNYHDVHATFPPAYVADKDGKPMHSWRVLLLPYLDRKDLYDQYRFDEPWNGPNNSRLASQMPEEFRCPSSTSGSPWTSYVGVSGPQAAFAGAKPIRLRDMVDGSSNTILVVESSGKRVHWMSPDDISPEEFKRNIERAGENGTFHSGGCHVLLVDGTVRFLPTDTFPPTIEALLTRAGGEVPGGF